MQQRVLGRTGLQVSVVGIGTWQLGGFWSKTFEQDEVDAIFARAGELGINFVDTAECYGDHVSERFIGNSLQACRDRWVIATKFGHNPGNGLKEENYSAPQVQLQLEASLRALRTDYIDVYQLHSASDELFDNDALWTMLDSQVQAGKVRFLGNSIGRPTNAFQAERSSHYGISVIQTNYNAVKREAEQAILPAAQRQGLGVIGRVPLASGFLSGKYRPGHAFPHNDVRSLRPQQGVDREIDAALAAMEARPPGMSPATWALAWCLQRPEVSTVIPGIKSLAQLEENALAGSAVLPAASA